MRKTLGSFSLVVAGTLGAGLLVGQLQGTPLAMAATKHVAAHAKANTKANTKPHQTAAARAQHADGKITNVSGNTITVQPDADQAGSNEYTKVTTIELGPNTTFKGNATKASLVVGAYIVAEGTPSADGTSLAATSVGVGGPGGHGGHGGGHGAPHADGTIQSVNGNTLKVAPDTDQAGSTEYTRVTTVLLTSATTFEHNTTQASLVQGAAFDAEGTLSADGTTLTATSIGVRGNRG